nr:toll/interleukin-1 receptor domain-containing protein [Paracoccus sp. S1E-3]
MQTALAKEDDKRLASITKEITRQEAIQAQHQRQEATRVVGAISHRIAAVSREAGASAEQYDVFISHASEDKDEFVRELAEKAESAGLRIFYDERKLKWGDSLRERIEHGLANSRFGIVVLSTAFFRKEWPKRELDGLFNLEIEGKSRILPIWHKISKDEVIRNAPSLSGKLALSTSSLSVDEIVEKLMEIAAV